MASGSQASAVHALNRDENAYRAILDSELDNLPNASVRDGRLFSESINGSAVFDGLQERVGVRRGGDGGSRGHCTNRWEAIGEENTQGQHDILGAKSADEIMRTRLRGG